MRSFWKKDLSYIWELSSCAKRKRTYDKSNPAYKWAALFITLMGIAALVYGIYALVTKAGFGIYFLLFGLAAIFFFSSANVLPTARNNRRYVEDRLKKRQKRCIATLQNIRSFLFRRVMHIRQYFEE